jgi:hypothetical protein
LLQFPLSAVQHQPSCPDQKRLTWQHQIGM